MHFDEATTWTPQGDRWAGTVSDDWMQGRAAFGGVVAAAGLRALRTTVDESRLPRTVTTTFYGPVTSEPAELTVRTLRAGRSVTFADAEIVQSGTLRARVAGMFGADRETVVQVPTPTIEVPEPDAFVPFPRLPGVTPAFIEQLELRWCEGEFPFTGAREGVVMAALLRFREPVAPGPERVIGLLDVMPAPVLQQLDGPRPASSIQWTSHLLAPDTAEPDDWWFFRYETISASAGYSTAVGKLYDAHGRLVAWQEQLHAVFG